MAIEITIPEDSIDVVDIMPYLEDLASRAQCIVELGCGCGNGSMRALTRGFRRSPRQPKCYISVDIRDQRPCTDIPDEAWWHLIRGDSANPRTVGKAVEFNAHWLPADIIFVDTEHTYAQVRMECEAWKGWASDGTVWLFHDIWMDNKRQELTDAILDFAHADGWTYTDLGYPVPGLGRLTR
jgi:hypothetical protein